MNVVQLYELVIGNPYLKALAILVVFFILSKIVYLIFEKVLLRLAKKTKTEIDDLIVEKIRNPINFILLLIGVRLALVPLEFTTGYISTIEKLIYTIIILLVTLMVARIFSVLIDSWGTKFTKITKSDLDDQLLGLTHKFSKIVVFIVGILVIFDYWGIAIGPFLASLGIAGLAIAFALQNTLANVFGGISLIIDKTIRIGDVIEVDGTTGTVIDIGMRSTRIKSFDGNSVIIPNGKLVDSKVQNRVQPNRKERAVISFGVEYGVNIKRVKKIVLKEINKIEGVLDDPEPSVKFIEMGDSALIFKAYFWMKSYSETFTAKDKANELIYNALNKAKINIPYPQMDVHLKKR
jgi:MscS family membrane protein